MSSKPVTFPTQITIKTILYATDFSPASTAVLPYACNMARQYDAELVVLHVDTADLLSTSPPVYANFRKKVEEDMAGLQRLPEFEGIRHRELVAEGGIYEAVEQLVEQEHIDLIVLATHGRTGWRKLVMGSVAERIFRGAMCPVMTLGPNVAPELRTQPRFGTIVYATDLPGVTTKSLDYALFLAAKNKSRLILSTVITETAKTDPPREITAAADALLSATPTQAMSDCIVDTAVTTGHAADGIVKIATENKADVIVLGAHKPTAMTTHLMDTAYKVVVESPCPVLTVRN